MIQPTTQMYYALKVYNTQFDVNCKHTRTHNAKYTLTWSAASHTFAVRRCQVARIYSAHSHRARVQVLRAIPICDDRILRDLLLRVLSAASLCVCGKSRGLVAGIVSRRRRRSGARRPITYPFKDHHKHKIHEAHIMQRKNM